MSPAGVVGLAETMLGTGSPAAEMLPHCCSRGLRNLGLGLKSGYSPCSLQTEESAASAFVSGRTAAAGAPGMGQSPSVCWALCLGWAMVGHGAGAEGQLVGDPAGDLVLLQ